MAFPSVASSTTTPIAAASASHAVNLDGAGAAGDRLLCLCRLAGSPTARNFPAGWTKTKEVSQAGTSNDWQILAYKDLIVGDAEIAAATMTVTTSGGSAKGAYVVHRILAGTFDPATPPEVSVDATGTSTLPNPANLAPAWGGAETLWLWAAGWEGEQTAPPTGTPTNFTNAAGIRSGTAGAVDTNCCVATAERQQNVASQDPPTWTISVSDDWLAWTVAIRPTSGVPNVNATSAVSGGGQADGVGAKGGQGASAVAGAGTLAASAAKGAQAASTVTGGGALEATSGPVTPPAFSAASSISGGGSLEAASQKSQLASSQVSGGGALEAAARKGGLVASQVAGDGRTLVVGFKGGLATSTITGGGHLNATAEAATPPVGVNATSSISGGGGLAGEAFKGGMAASGVAAGGSLTGAGTKGGAGVSALAGGGFVTSTGLKAGIAASSLAGGGDLSALITTGRFAFSIITGGGEIAGIGGSVQPAVPTVTTRTRVALKSSLTRASGGSGRTFAGSGSGRSGTTIEGGEA